VLVAGNQSSDTETKEALRQVKPFPSWGSEGYTKLLAWAKRAEQIVAKASR